MIACLVAGDPGYHDSLALLREIDAAGANIIEIVMPFSDPVADGPVIQEAIQRALMSGMNTDALFSLIRDFREVSETPILILTYANLVMQRGITAFYREAAQVGVDGVALADVPVEEADPFCRAACDAGIDPILFVSQTTSEERLLKILSRAGGFLYLVAALGVTGVRGEIDPVTVECIGRMKKVTNLPLVPGFGIGSPDQVRAYSLTGVDGVIVGSAIVNEINTRIGQPEEMKDAVGRKVRDLMAALG